MIYEVIQSPYTKYWLVINKTNSIAQSSWLNKRDAFKTASDLNRSFKSQIIRSKFQRS